MENSEESPNIASTDADISPLSVTAIQVHEIFTELKFSGFSHQDAIQIVGFMLSSGIMFNPNSSFNFNNSIINLLKNKTGRILKISIKRIYTNLLIISNNKNRNKSHQYF